MDKEEKELLRKRPELLPQFWIPPDRDEDYKIWVLLNQSRDSLLKFRAIELNDYGISAMEANALFYIVRHGGTTTAAKISRSIFREHNTTSALLNRMEKRGLVTKVRDSKRKNIWNIGITEKGQKAYENSVKRESIHNALSGLSSDDKQQLTMLLQKVRDDVLQKMITVPSYDYP